MDTALSVFGSTVSVRAQMDLTSEQEQIKTENVDHVDTGQLILTRIK